MSVAERAEKLRFLIRLLTEASEVVIKEWEAEAEHIPFRESSSSHIPSFELFEARRVVLGACGMCVDLVQDPLLRVAEVVSSFYPAKAINIASRARIADIVADADAREGVHIEKISRQAGINDKKLAQILRCLCSIHIFAEVKTNYFANTSTSQLLVHNESLRCWILASVIARYVGKNIKWTTFSSTEGSASTEKLPIVLFDPVKTHSFSPREAAFQEAYGTKLTFWEFLEEPIEQPDGTMGIRPELDVWINAMVATGEFEAGASCVDYPWDALGSRTIVDVGGGIGGMSLELAKRYPNLRFIVQDRDAVIRKAEAVWRQELPSALETGRVKFLVHDFFVEQPSTDAEIFLMRHILHDWADEECVAILRNLRQEMKPDSLLIIVDKAVHTTAGSPRLKAAPSPLPPNYGYAHHFASMFDICMLALFNGQERTPEELDALARRAGLKVTNVWECRSMTSVTELSRDDYEN